MRTRWIQTKREQKKNKSIAFEASEWNRFCEVEKSFLVNPKKKKIDMRLYEKFVATHLKTVFHSEVENRVLA